MKLEIKLPTVKNQTKPKLLMKFRAQICMSMFKRCWELNGLGMEKDETKEESWITEKAKGLTWCKVGGSLQRTDLRKRLSCNLGWKQGRRQTKEWLYQTFRCYRNTSYGWERHIFRPIEQPWLLKQRMFQKTWTSEEWHRWLESRVSQLKGESCNTSFEFLYLNKQIGTQLKLQCTGLFL